MLAPQSDVRPEASKAGAARGPDRTNALPGRVWRFLRRNVALVRALRNWLEVSRAIRDGTPVRRIEFRNGLVLGGPESAHLDFLFAEIWIDRVYSPKGFEIRDGDVVVDVGANIGVFSAFAALQARDVRVFAYEPFPGNVALLRSNTEGIRQSRVRVYPQAVGGSSGERILQTHPTNWIVHTVAGPDTTAPGLAVPCVSLDEVLASNGIERCSLLKLDCEGSEYEILRSARPETMRRVDKIVGEYHAVPGEPVGTRPESELTRLLESHGFCIDELTPFGECEGGVFHARRRPPEPAPREER